MSDTSLPHDYWMPGWRGTLRRGQKVITVAVSDLPNTFWDNPALNHVNHSLWAVGRKLQSSWVRYDGMPPYYPYNGLACRLTPDMTIMIPIEEYEKWFEAASNELGEVAP